MNSEMEKDILKVLVTEEELKTRIAELGEALYKRYEGHRPLFLGVLKGSFIFMADLMRASQLMCDVEFIAVSSYQNGTVSSGRVQITHDLQQDITGRELVIVEDILDSGNTLAFLKKYLMAKGAKSISIVTCRTAFELAMAPPGHFFRFTTAIFRTISSSEDFGTSFQYCLLYTSRCV